MKRVEATEYDYQILISGEVPPLKSVLAILQSKNSVYIEDVEYANSILKGAGTYLCSFGALKRFIRSEAEEDSTAADVEFQKKLIERLRNLFPEIIKLLRIEQPERAGAVLHIIHDACSDYKCVIAQGRQDANRKRITSKLERLENRVRELCDLMEDHEVAQGIGFQHAYTRYRKHVHDDQEEARPFWELQNELKFLSRYLELETHRARTRPNALYVPDNQAKTHLVDAAYGLALDNGYPQFVTTPGSDFGFFCSLLYEIATGIADESLAGATNRYARSKARAESDHHAIEYGEDWERARDEDNFFDVKKAAVRAEQRARELSAELRDTRLSNEARMLIIIELEECRELIENQHKIHGPFLMWASQMKSDWPEELSKFEIMNAAERELDIALGKRRRSKKKST